MAADTKARRIEQQINAGRPCNTFYVVLTGESTATAWNPHDSEDLPAPECRYFGRVLAVLDDYLGPANATVYLSWNLRRLPSYGEDVVAFVMADEWGRYPTYAHRVAAIFKCYGTTFELARNSLASRTFSYRAAVIGQFVRTSLVRATSRLAYELQRVADPAGTPNIIPIPLGYYRQVDLPMIDIADRPYDIYFGGSATQTDGGWKNEISAKAISRREMREAIADYGAARPERRIATKWTASFYDVAPDSAITYSHMMMSSKIAIVPRGTSLETFRFFEAMRAGCIVVHEALPEFWFYEGAPTIEISDWTELPVVLNRILDDPKEMLRLHNATLTWWRERCSEDFLGAFAALAVQRRWAEAPDRI